MDLESYQTQWASLTARLPERARATGESDRINHGMARDSRAWSRSSCRAVGADHGKVCAWRHACAYLWEEDLEESGRRARLVRVRHWPPLADPPIRFAIGDSA